MSQFIRYVYNKLCNIPNSTSCIPCRSLIDYIMPVKEMVRKMTGRRKYVIISNNPDPDYLDDIEETFVRV